MRKCYIDTETCGLHGMPVLIQYAFDDGPVQLYSPWSERIDDTIKLIEEIVDCGVVGFNLAFDWFQLTKLYTVLSLYKDWSAYPEDIVDDLADLEPLGRDGPCLKPRSCMDLMLHARKGPYQSTMARSDIRIRRIPTALAWQLANELEKRIPLADIYFARKKDKTQPQWQVFDIENQPDFKDIVLKFAASSALKALAADALKVKTDNILLFGDIGVPKEFNPTELGYAPFAKAIGKRGDWRNTWPEYVLRHHRHWKHHSIARRYAEDDVKYTRDLYKHFESPELGDDDSVLACMVASVRWHGYKVDIEGLKRLQKDTLAKQYGIDDKGKRFEIPTSPHKARHYIGELMDSDERLISDCSIEGSTNKVVLSKISKWEKACDCSIESDCAKCDNTRKVQHPAAARAKQVLDARQAQYESNLYSKFIQAGRFHPSLAVIGTLSSRMGGGGSAKGVESGGFAGGDGLNAQGVKKAEEVRSQFPLAFDGYDLCGGDFAAYEVTLAEAEYNDPDLRKQLLTCEECRGPMTFILDKIRVDKFLSAEGMEKYIPLRLRLEQEAVKDAKKKGKTYKPKVEAEIREESFENDFICTCCGNRDGLKIHALFGTNVYPPLDYYQIKKDKDKYTKSKSAVFAMLYGGTEHTLMTRLEVARDVALAALAKFHRQFPGVKRSQQSITDAFCSMQQVGGIGSKVVWKDPAEYVESMFGFRRYFTLENQIAKALFNLANKPPISWRNVRVKVVRRDREQTASGAIQSALYGAAFGMQAGNTRAANNHKIQSAGATITKVVQRKIWDVQPCGIHRFRVIPMNIHDEIMCPTLPEYKAEVAKIVKETVESFRPKVPLIKMDWVTNLGTWADKG